MLGSGIAAAGALETGIAAGTALAGGIGLLGELGLSTIGTPAMGGLASLPAATATQIAPAAAAQAAGTVAPSLTQSLGLDALKQGAISQGMSNTAAMQAANLPAQSAASQVAQAAAPTWQQYAAQQGWTNPTGPAAEVTRQTLPSGLTKGANAFENAMNLFKNPSWQGAKDYAEEHPFVTSGAVGLASKALFSQPEVNQPKDKSYIRPYSLDVQNLSGEPGVPGSSAERQQLTYNFTPQAPYAANTNPVKKAVGGPIEMMSAMNAVGDNTTYPQAGINTAMYSNPVTQRPFAQNVIAPSSDAAVDPFTGEQRFATGGIADLGGYSDGGRLLKGPGDGVSDSIPAVIGAKQPARLADGEFVVPARIVSELGNGSTEAGARKLYAMMDRVQKSRGKTVGKNKVAVNSKADKHLPA
jgi:hypothetical protein